MSGEHTKTPWIVYDDDTSDSLAITTENRMDHSMVEIATVSIGFDEPFESKQRANAAFIVEAVNSHESLKDELEAVEQLAKSCAEEVLDLRRQLSEVRALLASAAKRLESCIVASGTDKEYAALAVDDYRRAAQEQP